MKDKISLTERLQNAHWDYEEYIDHKFSRDELDALEEMTRNLRLHDIGLEGSVGGPNPDEFLAAVLYIGGQAYKIEGVPNDMARQLWEVLTHLPHLIEWAKDQTKF